MLIFLSHLKYLKDMMSSMTGRKNQEMIQSLSPDTLMLIVSKVLWSTSETHFVVQENLVLWFNICISFSIPTLSITLVIEIRWRVKSLDRKKKRNKISLDSQNVDTKMWKIICEGNHDIRRCSCVASLSLSQGWSTLSFFGQMIYVRIWWWWSHEERLSRILWFLNQKWGLTKLILEIQERHHMLK